MKSPNRFSCIVSLFNYKITLICFRNRKKIYWHAYATFSGNGLPKTQENVKIYVVKTNGRKSTTPFFP